MTLDRSTEPGAPAEIAIHGVSRGDAVYQGAISLFALSVPALLLAIAVAVAIAGWPALRQFGFSFLTTSAWDPVNGQFGAAPAIYGTIVSSIIALVVATPLALGVSLFLSEFAPLWMRQPVAFLVDLLAAIPSVVYGLWGISCCCRCCAIRSCHSCATLCTSAPPYSSRGRHMGQACWAPVSSFR